MGAGASTGVTTAPAVTEEALIAAAEAATADELVAVLKKMPADTHARLAEALEAVAVTTVTDPDAPPFYPVAPEDGELNVISTVMDGLYLANWRGADDKDRVKELGVTHMVAVGTEFVDDKMEGIVFWKKDIGDDEDAADEMAKSLREVAGFIHKSISGGGKSLVHCAAGISRSSTCVLAYLVLHASKTLRDAFGMVIEARRPVWPNDGFMRILIALEVEHRKLKPEEASITIDEYIKWGDYEPPPEEEARPLMPRLMRRPTFVDTSERHNSTGLLPPSLDKSLRESAQSVFSNMSLDDRLSALGQSSASLVDDEESHATRASNASRVSGGSKRSSIGRADRMKLARQSSEEARSKRDSESGPPGGEGK